jgi:hypothetical protein
MATPPQCPEFRAPTWREAMFPEPEPIDMTPVLVEIGGEGRVVPLAAVRHLAAQEQMAHAQVDLMVLASSPTAALAYLGATAVGKGLEDRRRAMLVGAQVEALVVSLRGPVLSRALGMQKEVRPTPAPRRATQVQRPPVTPLKFSNETKIRAQMKQRGWTETQVREALATSGVPAQGKEGPARRYIHPQTGQSVVTDNATGEIFHVGGAGFRYDQPAN